MARIVDTKIFLKDNSLLLSNCEGSDFTDKDHQHEVAGNLQIKKINKLRNLLTKGPKYK